MRWYSVRLATSWRGIDAKGVHCSPIGDTVLTDEDGGRPIQKADAAIAVQSEDGLLFDTDDDSDDDFDQYVDHHHSTVLRHAI